MNYPQECELCNSPQISACDECEQTLSFGCDSCGGMFEIEKNFDERSRWWDSKRICDICGLNKATLFVDGNNSCNECEFNRIRKGKK